MLPVYDLISLIMRFLIMIFGLLFGSLFIYKSKKLNIKILLYAGLSLFFGYLPSLRPRESWLINGVVNHSYSLAYTRLWFECWSSSTRSSRPKG